jgi:hypothetical protein
LFTSYNGFGRGGGGGLKNTVKYFRCTHYTGPQIRTYAGVE